MKYNKLLMLIISIVAICITVLLVLTINYQYSIGSSINLGKGINKYVIGAMLILIPILAVLLLRAYKKESLFKKNLSNHEKIFDFENEKSKRDSIEVEDKLLNVLKANESRKNLEIKTDIAPCEEVIENKEEIKEDISSELIAERLENDEFLEEFTPASETRFYMLSQIDKAQEEKIEPVYNDSISLKELCDEFRNFASYKLKLYYDIKDIRRFIAGFAVTKILILQGMSGTGKTSLAYAFGEFLKNKTVVVPIQPMWKERTDLIGYYNEFTRKFNETTLLYKMYEASYSDDIYVTVLDEMNIARVEYYFAEFLSLLELPNPEGRNLDVVSDVWETDPKLLRDGKLRLPINMWFIGTANNDDSTFAISDKVYDRAMVLNLDTKAEVFEGAKTDGQRISIKHLTKLFNSAMKEYDLSSRNLRRIKELDKYLIKTFHITFGNRIMKQIRAYVPVLVACGGTELDGLDDILARKVLRKLESKNPVYVKSQSEALCQYLDELFGADKMPLCKEVIHNIEQNS